MIVGLLADIHGNSEALRQVLKEARKAGVDYWLILGDCIGYYYDAKGVFDLLEEWESKTFIRGNHENFLLDILSKRIEPDQIYRKYGSGIQVALSSLTADKIQEIERWQETTDLLLDGLKIRISHGAPWDANSYIYPDSDIKMFEKCYDRQIDFVFLAHTHYPLIHFGPNIVIANPGSVGQSRVHGGIADWAIVDTVRKVYVSKQTRYDASRLSELARTTDPHVPYLHSVLNR